MKIIVAVIVYDRIQNIERWISCWNQCDTDNAELIIINNADNIKSIKHILADEAKLIIRPNVGYDIGAMQDVFKERLTGFPNDWDYLLWCTDDVIPMQKDFISPFRENMKPGIGIAAMQISTEKIPHVRTTGFMISKEISKKIIFPADPILTKKHCYEFEHGKNNFTEQIRRMELDCVQVAPLIRSPLYDIGWPVRNNKVLRDRSRFDRINEHENLFRHD